ncbi:MAG: Holliday junction resolvase RuvX, partial [Chloroflexota bacterium]
MGLDLGEKRVGVALSDESQTLATPFEIVRRVSFAKLIARIQQIIAAQSVAALVVGFPRSLNGQIGPQAQHVADEAERLREQLRLPVT